MLTIPPIVTVFRNGLALESPQEMFYLLRNVYFRHTYTPAPLSIRKGNVVVDIGAHMGAFALYAASRGATVYAFEPSPATFAVLEHNVQASRLNVVAQRSAVSDRTGTASLLLHHRTSLGNTLYFQAENLEAYRAADGTLPFDPPVVDNETQQIETPTTTLQEIIERHHIAQIDFLKLDCEGAEGVILPSLPAMCLSRIRQIALEFHDHLSPVRHESLQLLLEQAGFAVRVHWKAPSAFGLLYAWRP